MHFVHEVCDIINAHRACTENIYNLYETAVFFDHSKATTLVGGGASDVPIPSFENENQRVIGVSSASATGHRRPECIMNNAAAANSSEHVVEGHDVMPLNISTTWMNAAASVVYVDALFPPPLEPNTVLLVFLTMLVATQHTQFETIYTSVVSCLPSIREA